MLFKNVQWCLGVDDVLVLVFRTPKKCFEATKRECDLLSQSVCYSKMSNGGCVGSRWHPGSSV